MHSPFDELVSFTTKAIVFEGAGDIPVDFNRDIDDLVKRLNRRELEPSQASELILRLVEEHLGARATPTVLSGLEKYLDAACRRHFGGDCDDSSLQTFLARQVKRLTSGRLAPPQVDGEIVWI